MVRLLGDLETAANGPAARDAYTAQADGQAAEQAARPGRARGEQGPVFGAQGGPWEFNLRDLLRWADLTERSVLVVASNPASQQALAEDGALLLGERLRTAAERQEVSAVLAKIMNVQEAAALLMALKGVVWTPGMRRMYTLVNSGTDTSDLLGSFEQVDPGRRVQEAAGRVQHLALALTQQLLVNGPVTKPEGPQASLAGGQAAHIDATAETVAAALQEPPTPHAGGRAAPGTSLASRLLDVENIQAAWHQYCQTLQAERASGLESTPSSHTHQLQLLSHTVLQG
ncbi:midasin [Haematococcus lacustris]|uniref:Midasin n=1 Tax=Haematococcus lacustris TaxID=44745 RepID=A0A699Z9V4_HAELA|nr:midasin [Haematococcus lacustris]